MAHFAQLDENNIVLRVIVISNNDAPDPSPENSEEAGINFINHLATGDESLLGTWRQTSYNDTFRKQFAKIGDTYNEELDMFISPKPFPSWSLDENGDWLPPIPCPVPGMMWEEETQSWVYPTFEE
jgi:hypothetical protein